MSNNQEEQQQQRLLARQQLTAQQQQQYQQQQYQQQQPQPQYRFYNEQHQHQQPPYQHPSYTNTFFPNNNNNNYYNPALMNSNTSNDIPIHYYQQQSYQIYQPPQPQVRIHEPQATIEQFNDPVVSTELDEFIVDQLRKPQERLFLLKLELELEAFIKDKEKLRLDLPSMNSYQRRMVHRLAPYYKLNHYHDAMRKAVYVCRTSITALPSVRLPDIQQDKNESIDNDDDSSSNNTLNTIRNNDSPPQFKIMRRSTEPSYLLSSASKNEDQSKTVRKNMTLEERKTAYEEARARIFQDMEK
ncbi:hypothetical protein [Parasitella parasitica]|uniref:SUZ domain-containing protein n=1 Tax=Parasitella parasitica TaxID=35722 RepID=A0A0B7N174_9FUNG|nr:hypothetical protein [Parasitella parasitica]